MHPDIRDPSQSERRGCAWPFACFLNMSLLLTPHLGVSMITQVLYGMVFCTRYTDIFNEPSAWNFFFKLFYIVSSIYIIVIMRWLFPRTREREIAWKMGAAVLAGSLVISPFVMMIFESPWGFFTVRSSPLTPDMQMLSRSRY
jgi:hypothetical protein